MLTKVTGSTPHNNDLIDACSASYTRLVDPANWSCYSDTLDVLQTLQSRGHGLSILSNFDSRGEQIVARLLSEVVWSRIDLSFQTGLLKPDKASFRSHCESLGIEPQQSTMVGDDLWQDGSAIATGMKFCNVNYPQMTLRQSLVAYL